MDSQLKRYIYDYENISFTLFINEYWEKIYRGKPREKLYHDYQKMLEVVKKVSKEKYIMDVGANHGIFSIPASMLGYKVIGFEPVKSNFNNIEQARNENNLSDFFIFNLALSNETGEKEIYVPECPDNASFSQEAAIANMKRKDYEVENVRVVRFDDWIESRPHFKNIGLIKIDAQGSEYEIIIGMRDFLNQAANDIYLIVEFEDHLIKMGHTYKELDDLIISFGFTDLGKLVGNDKWFYKG